jgi:hypothetical protein
MTHHDEGDRPRGERARESSPHGGPEDLQFLDLEISKVLISEASQLARQAYQQVLVETIKERLMDRLGALIESLADAAVEDLAADLEANIDIERRIKARAEARLHQSKTIASIFDSPVVDESTLESDD